MGMCYIAKRTDCGCTKAAISEACGPKEIATETGKWFRRGFAVEHVDAQVVRDGPWSCTICDPPKVKKSAVKQEVLGL